MGYTYTKRFIEDSGVTELPEFYPAALLRGPITRPGSPSRLHKSGTEVIGSRGRGGQSGYRLWPTEPDPHLSLSLSLCVPLRPPSPGIWDKKDFFPRPAPSSQESQGAAWPAPAHVFGGKLQQARTPRRRLPARPKDKIT